MSMARTDRPVVVAMLTFRRPDDLGEAIPAVLEQIREIGPEASLLIVDNDPEGSAEPTVTRWVAPDVRYVHEPRPGIAAGRNRALDECPDDALVVFIDDDERPQHGWLAAMLATHRKYAGAAVVGAVVSEYEIEPDKWITAGRFFDRRRMPTGTHTDVAATNNLLLDLALVRRSGLRFDDRFGQSGGSDTLFSRQLAAVGSLVWCDEAVVVDRVPAERLTRSWVLRRAFRSGNSWVRTSLVLAHSGRARTRVRLATTARGTVRVAGGAGRMFLGTATGSIDERARGRRTVARGAGMLAGVWGHVHVEYRRTPEAFELVKPFHESKSDTHQEATCPGPGAPAVSRSPQLGVVVVNYGSSDLLPMALDHLAAVPAVVVVVDNWHSSAERRAVSALCTEHNWTLVARAGNDGFGTAANVGTNLLLDRGCDVVLVLNPDARIGVDDCRRLAQIARQHTDSLVSPLIERPDGTTWFRGIELRVGTGRPVRPGGTFVSAPNSVLTGACLAASSTLWRRLGGFRDDYFLYWEDFDLCTRCIQGGGSLMVVEDVVAEHAVGGTQQSVDNRGRSKSRVYYRYNCRNRLVYAARNLPTAQLVMWVTHTFGESWAILLRGGRRQILSSPAVLLSAARGTAAGMVIAAVELIGRMTGAREAPADAQNSPTASRTT